jgi:PhnB protein
MTKINLNPYLFFGGNCREAMEFYKEIFGGELQMTTFGEGPAGAHADPKANSEEMKSKIMHARLVGDITILASDNPHNTETTDTGQFSLSLEGSDENLLKSYFDKLSEEGKVTTPLVKQFWGAVFGMVKDKFGINWMVNITPIDK